MTNFDDIAHMTLAEYYLRLEAYKLRRVLRANDQSEQAWQNQVVQATRGSGKSIRPKYRQFDEFFDLTASVDDVRMQFEPWYRPKVRHKSRFDEARAMIKRAEEFQKLKAAGKIIPYSQRKEVKHGG